MIAYVLQQLRLSWLLKAYLRARVAMARWAGEQLPSEACALPRPIDWRVWLAVLIAYGWRVVVDRACWEFRCWTVLPGDEVESFARYLHGVVVHVPRPGRCEVVWATREAIVRDEAILDRATRAVGTEPPWLAPYEFCVPAALFRECDVDARLVVR